MRNLTTLFISLIAVTASCQTTSFYKNIFGAYGSNEYQNAPLVNALEKLNNSNYFVTTSYNSNAGYYSCAKLDSNFNAIWTQSFLPNGTTSMTTFERSAELTDGSIVTTGYSNGTANFTKFDPQGDLEFSKYYGASPTDDYNTSAIIESNLDDTSYVALFAQCAVHFGIFKFNKDGEVIWGHEYQYSGPYIGSIYDIEHGLNQGYLCRGTYNGSVYKRGLLLLTKEDGTLDVCKEYGHSDTAYAHAAPGPLYTSKLDSSYYVSMNYVLETPPGAPYEYESGHLVKLDSNLEVINDWHLEHPDPNINLNIRNITGTNDGKLIVNGYMKDDVNYPSNRFFILKLDPSLPSNNIVWAKSFVGLSSTQYWHSSFSVNGLYTTASNNQIIMPMSAYRDGSSVMSLDEDALQMCDLTDLTLTSSAGSGITTYNKNLTFGIQSYNTYNNTLLPFDEVHSDTMLCGLDPVGTNDFDVEKELVQITNQIGQTMISNLSDKPVAVTIYNVQGKLVFNSTIPAFSNQHLYESSTGVLLFKAVQDNYIQRGKFYHQ